VSAAEDALLVAWRHGAPAGVAHPEREWRFHPERRWRFDFAWPNIKLAAEIDGRGRHQTVVGVRNDCEKLNEALRLGWRVLRFPACDKTLAADWVRTILEVMCNAS
jgi:very-short-patch-repair endonuclease